MLYFYLKVILLAVIQGMAELLPVSSSAHVIVAEKLMGLDPSSPAMTLLLVMLHTGTMVAVIVYFWRQWRTAYFKNADAFKAFTYRVALATALTGIVGEAIVKLLEKTIFANVPHAEIEDLFSHLEWIAPALAAAGLLILIAGIYERRNLVRKTAGLTSMQTGLIGAVQGLCLPFRGFSRSGSTISTGLLAGVSKSSAEEFSFALAVVLTPPIVVREALRSIHSQQGNGSAGLATAIVPSLFGAVCAFLAGLLALKWLSRWLEQGHWYWFGVYCLGAAVVVAILHAAGY
jgi:undecaprenyl-diphosphatase